GCRLAASLISPPLPHCYRNSCESLRAVAFGTVRFREVGFGSKWKSSARGLLFRIWPHNRTSDRRVNECAPKLGRELNTFAMSASDGIVLQKSPRRSCGIEIRNNRIGANRCCAFTLDLESILRARMRKIVLQHNRWQSRLFAAIEHFRF